MLPHPLPLPPLGAPQATHSQASFSDPFAAVRDTTGLTPAFTNRLNELFPGAMQHEEAAVAIKHTLRKHGFTAAGSIALVAQCRDEITKPFHTAIDHTWNGSFNIGALAGTVICGTTGFNAALHHAPQDEDGKERYVVFCGPHIAIDENGEVGKVIRRGRKNASSACGALIAFQKELCTGHLDVTDKPLDVEYAYLRRNVLPLLHFGEPAPSLATLTHHAHNATVESVRKILAEVGHDKSMHAVVSGVLIHGPNFSHFFWPGILEVVDDKGALTDVRKELMRATRPDYHSEMLWYLTAKSQSSSLLCSDCTTTVEPTPKEAYPVAQH
jgi:hypothetical protein